MPFNTRFRVALDSNHSDAKMVICTYDTVADLCTKLQSARGKLKGWKKNDVLFYNNKRLSEYDDTIVFPNDSFIVISPPGKQPVFHSVEKLFSPVTFLHQKSPVDDIAIKQLHQCAHLPGMINCVGMPDLHPGTSFPIGAAFLSNIVYPALVGQDIGCGMTMFNMSHFVYPDNKKGLKNLYESLEKFVTENEKTCNKVCEPRQFLSSRVADDVLLKYHHWNFGTIGGGNHFAELQECIESMDEKSFQKEGLYLLVHSGSRTLGEHVLKNFKETGDTNAYMREHDICLENGHNVTGWLLEPGLQKSAKLSLVRKSLIYAITMWCNMTTRFFIEKVLHLQPKN